MAMTMAISLRSALCRAHALGLSYGAGLHKTTRPAHRAFSSSSISSLISEEEIQRFEEDGATVVRQLFPPEWLDQLRAAAEDNMKNPGALCDEHVKPGEPGRFHDDQFLWRRHETMRHFIHESPAAEIARRMMRGKQVQLFYDQLFVKEPGTRKATPWHNDHSYWQLKGNQVISLWLALDHVPKSSCVKYVKGSH
jgi:ectoine hydroxylase-related dioxygenase (phytanoyl-CoA dioxygenase family)